MGYLAAPGGIAAATAAMAPFHDQLSPTTVALVLLLVILLVATKWGSRPGYLASLLGVLSFNYFFLPPVGTLTIADPQNWVALAAFLITAIMAGQLSVRVKRRALEAEAGRSEIERLYQELRAAFERASETEALRRSEQLKSALIDSITHDLRTPLTSIKASVTTLLEERHTGSGVGTESSLKLDDEGRQEMLDVINEETDRLNHFIEGIVELARIEAGDLDLGRRWGAIDDILSIALARAERITGEHKIDIDLEKELPLVRVDARAVAEVIYLLVDNASKYSSPGTTIRVAATRPSDDVIQLSVEDEGCGIPQGLRDRIFERFFQASPGLGTTSQRASGIGMGLAIARGIVEAHGGRIWVEDGPRGRGTRVAFTVPIGEDEMSGASDGGTTKSADAARVTR